MKKVILMSILFTVISSCSHFGKNSSAEHQEKSQQADCGCGMMKEKGQPCADCAQKAKAASDEEGCDDCKKAGK